MRGNFRNQCLYSTETTGAENGRRKHTLFSRNKLVTYLVKVRKCLLSQDNEMINLLSLANKKLLLHIIFTSSGLVACIDGVLTTVATKFELKMSGE